MGQKPNVNFFFGGTIRGGHFQNGILEKSLSKMFADAQGAMLAYVNLEYFKKAFFNKLSGLFHSSLVPTSLASILVRILNIEHG